MGLVANQDESPASVLDAAVDAEITWAIQATLFIEHG